MDAMSMSWNEGRFVDYKAQLSLKHNCLNVWELIDLVGMGHFTKGMDRQTTSMGITEVFQELILDILKQVRNVSMLQCFCTSVAACTEDALYTDQP